MSNGSGPRISTCTVLQEQQPLLNQAVRRRSELKLDLKAGDVCFIVGKDEEKVRCRRDTLTATSPVLGSMVIDAWHSGKPNEVIKIPDVHPEHFRTFLKHLDEDENFKISTTDYSVDEVAQVFKLAKTYAVDKLVVKCREFFNVVRNVSNAVSIYQYALELNEVQLEYDTYAYIIDNFSKILWSPDFVNIDASSLETFLKLDEVRVKEIHLFKAVYRWAETRCHAEGLCKSSAANPDDVRKVLGECLYLIRFPLMTPLELVTQVYPTGLLSYTEIEVLNKYLVMVERNKRTCRIPGSVDVRPFCSKPRGIELQKTYTACFYDCLIYNSDAWTGKWKYNLFSCDRSILIVSFGFDGPVLQTTIYEVKVKVVECKDENSIDSMSSDLSVIGSKEQSVLATKQRVFHVKFENPLRIKPNVTYKVCYSLRGPKTIWGAEPKRDIRLTCGNADINFNFQCVDGQVPEVRFILPS